MKMPPNSPTLEDAKEKLHRHYNAIEKTLLHEVDELANSGFAGRRWAAIARTHFEEGVMALHRSLRDFPGSDPNQYGKVPMPQPGGFAPPRVDDQTQVGPEPDISKAIRDMKPGGFDGPTGAD
jgi:hypothetical protein